MSEETPVMNVAEKYRKAIDDMAYLYDWSESPDRKRIDNVMSLLSELWIEHTKFPVSSTLDRLLDKYFDPADTKRRTDFVESDLGEIEHKGEKVMVKIKVVRCQ